MFTGQLDSYSSLPRLVEEGCAGFDIFQFRKEYFAIAQRLRSLDLSRVSEDRLNEYRTEGLVYVGRSLQELKETIAMQNYTGDRSFARNQSSGGSASIDICDASTEVRAFLAENILEDRCSDRRSFNPSEYRYGDRQAEILDYLLIADGVADPLSVQSGATCVLYMKVLYRSNVNWPMFGLAIKTVDGQTVNGINTMMTGTILAPVTENQIVHVKFEWEAWLNGGDYFIDLGCAEVQNGESVPLDRRYGLVHMVVETREHFSGQANLRASVTEVSRVSSVFTK